ncbi:DUF4810 domain-containing protein [Sulfurimonas paralvinellae]|uniref:DUF4810 domain-containing protein n=1 Tax=Sulfurimonas paralvinellae TaxID=317658 RepID=A0A7M1B9X3_9BACT|nr:DUF4810 domain-containing protein [Sulfurimonas paralvinellae]QOP46494.1 DUF4810 domain-containing protein [Sulfurimonas paralvinellae]
MRKNNLIFPSILFAALFMAGCSSHNQALYNYGTYSESYYSDVKDHTHESQLALQKSIEDAIQNAQDSTSGRVAPGLYANLGYIYLKKGQSKLAVENFKKEKVLYPESAKLMDMLIKKVAMAEEDKNEK